MHRLLFFVLGYALLAPLLVAGEEASVYEKRCKLCHSIAGSGGPMAKMGGALDGVGSKRDAQWLKEYLKNPKSKSSQSAMPALKLTDEERDAVVRYLLSLK
jgi:mono/diheme cytochrome c family protein